MTPDVAAALDLLRETLESLAHHAISAAVREVTKTDLLPALALVAQALADGAEGERLHEALYAAAVAENDRIRAGWNAAEQALADAEVRTQALARVISDLRAQRVEREDAIRKLCAELNDYSLAAVQEGAGITNRRVIELRRDEAMALLSTEAPRGE